MAEFNARSTNSDMAASIRDELTSDGNIFTNSVDAVRRAFDTTNDSARAFLNILDQIQNAGTFEQQAQALTRAREYVETLTGGLSHAEGEAGRVLVQLINAEDAALRLAAAGESSDGAIRSASGSASDLSFTIGTAADEAARLLANLGSVPGALAAMGRSVDGQIASITAMNRSLNIQISEGLSSAAANRRVQLQDFIEAGNAAGTLNLDEVARRAEQINTLEAAVREGDALRERLREQNTPARQARRTGGGGGGGSRTAQLTEEQQAVQHLNETLRDRLTSLQNERVALELVASGQFENIEAANLYAEAARLSGGAVDEQTLAMIRQIDAAQSLNEALQSLANDPVRQWMDSVPNWIEAGQQIEMGVIDGLKGAISDLITTGEFDIESLGETILGVIADVVADKAVAELWTLLGRNEAGSTGLGGFLGGLFGGEEEQQALSLAGGDTGQALVSGSQQAGQNIQSAMVQGGQQVAQSIQSALQMGGQTVQTSAQAGLTAGAQQVRTAGQTGLTSGAMQVRSAGLQGGQQMQQGVVTGSQQGAQILASGVASGAGGSSGLSSGVGSIFSMILGGLFSEGGNSTNAVAHAAVPASAFRHAPHYAEGTANTSGIPAILHPSEAVVPLSKNRKIPVDLGNAEGGGQTFNQVQNFTINTPDADSFRRSRQQIEADMARSGQRAMRKNH